MTPSVADKTPIPAKVWRRHTDPPGLWIYVVIGSVSLHLLVFWLMRSSNTFSLWFPQQSQSAIPIELIDIAPQTKSTSKSQSIAKTVSAKRSSSTENSVSVRTTPKNQDFAARNSTENLQPKSKTDASQTNSQPFRQQKVPKLIPRSTVTPTLTVSVGNLPWNRRQDLKFGKGTPLPTGIPSKPPVKEIPPAPTGDIPATPTKETPTTSTGQAPPTPTKETPPTSTGQAPPTPTKETPPTSTGQAPPTPTKETPQTPTGEAPPTPTRETPQTPTGEASPTPTQGASVAIVAPLLRDEVNSLIKAGRLRQDALPDAIAVYQGSNTKQLDSSFLPQDFGLKPAELLASLVIDRNGNFQQAFVLEIEPATLQSEKRTYQQVLNEVFKTENFVAAHNNDGTKPDLSNLVVLIKIQPANSN